MQSDRCPECKPLTTLGSTAAHRAKQVAILRFLRDFIGANGYAPSFEEIRSSFGYGSLATVHEHLKNIERKGYIRRVLNANRSIALVDE